jgi:hypothetical protein
MQRANRAGHVLATGGQLPTNRDKLLEKIRAHVPDVSEGEVLPPSATSSLVEPRTRCARNAGGGFALFQISPRG